MTGIHKDVGFGVRMLARSPGFTATALLSLALGIGANTAIFSVVHAVLLRPFPVREPHRLVLIEEKREGMPMALSSYPTYRDIRDGCDAFEEVAASTQWPASVKVGGKPKVLLTKLVTGNYFSLLGVDPFLGRMFRPGETVKSGEPGLAVISHDLWQSGFGAERDAIGRDIFVNNRPFTLIGVAPPGFRGEMAGFAVDVWIPVTMLSAIFLTENMLEDRASGWLGMLARLKRGVTPAQANAALGALAGRLRGEYPETNRATSFAVVSGPAARFPIPAMGRGITMLLSTVMAVVGFVLLMACSNVANLMMARAVGREREIAIRFALGAGRWRIVRQLLVESLLLALAAGALGLLFAVWMLQLFTIPRPPTPLPVALEAGLDSAVLLFTLAASLAAALVFGTLPAVQASGLRLLPPLSGRQRASAGRPGKARLQGALVFAQIALSVMLLAGTGLLARSLRAAFTIHPGFETSHGIVVDLNVAHARYTEQQGRVFYRRLVAELSDLPGVESASLAVFAPLSFAKQSDRVVIDGYQPQHGGTLFVDYNSVGHAFFRTLGIPIVRGRAFSEQDVAGSQEVAIINQTMAERFWSGRDPVGLSFTMSGRRVRIVGVVRDSKWFMLSDGPQPFIYRPFFQNYAPMASLHVRTVGDPELLLPAVLSVIERLDPNLPLANARTMERHMALSRYPMTIAAMMAGGFGVLALVLAVVGVYGVMSHAVGRRIHEFGIRAALGAGRGQMLAMVLRSGAGVALGGAAVGLAGAWALGRALSGSGVLVGVGPHAPDVLIGAALIVLISTAAASVFPVRSATAIPPSEALRYE